MSRPILLSRGAVPPAPAVRPRLIGGAVGAGLIGLAFAAPGVSVTRYYVTAQDLPALTLMAIILVLARRSGPAPGFVAPAARLGATPWPMAGVLMVAAFMGHHLLFGGYAFSPDEQRTLMDAAIFAGGALSAPLPAWDGDPDLILPSLTRLSADEARWASAYLPVNAAIHAAALRLGSTALAAPILAGIAVVATWRCARRLWPDEPALAPVAALFVVTSAQVVLTAMTPFAMTAHLAFNMVWLWLFLRGGRVGHAGAMLVGLAAMGLHQYAFHPLFAGPFLATLLVRRRFALAGAYAIAYAGGLLFWIAYPDWVMTESALSTRGGFARHLLDLVTDASSASATMMAANLVRYAAWQNAVWLPFAVVGAWAALRGRRPEELALVGALVAMPLFALVVLPNQGFGWGYRYLHGSIGAGALLAASGFRTLAARGFRPGRALALGTLGTLTLTLPFLAFTATRLIGPVARAEAAVAALGPGFVVIEDAVAGLTGGLLVNGPTAPEGQVRMRRSRMPDSHACAAPRAGDAVVVTAPRIHDAPIAWRCETEGTIR